MATAYRSTTAYRAAINYRGAAGGIGGNASGLIGTLTVQSPQATAFGAGTGAGIGSLPLIAVLAFSGTATGTATVSGALVVITVSAPVAASDVSPFVRFRASTLSQKVFVTSTASRPFTTATLG